MKLTHRQIIYLGILLMWLAVGAITMQASTNISRISYGSALLVLLLTTLDNIFLE